MIKAALVIKGKEGIELFRSLKQCGELDLVGLVCLDGKIDWLTEAEKKECFVTSDVDKIAALPELDTIIDGSGDPAVSEYLANALNGNVKIEGLGPRSLLSAILDSREQFFETKMLKGELLAILNSVQDAIEVVDAKGVVKYVNPAFTRVTGIPESKRLGCSIFDVSPHGALANSLIQQKAVRGYRTYVGGSEADVISNASPIFVDGELMGAVVVFQPVGDILKLMDELKHSNAIIDNLYAQLDEISGSRINFESLTGHSKIFLAAVERARKAARSDLAVMIFGESGSGKSLFARAIHNSSFRNRRPLIVVDCASIPDSLQEIEIFGCEKGALPGVQRTRIGKIELAEGSTLYIKEINSLNLFLQKKILNVIDEKIFYRIGSEQPIPIEVRIIASSGEDLLKLSVQGSFLEELYRRLSQLTVSLPPLRKRSEDIPLLAMEMIDRINRKLGKRVSEILPRALQELIEYDWPGNISELESVVERSMIVADGAVIEHHHLSPYIGRLGIKEITAYDEIIPLDQMEEMMLKLALTRFGESLEGKKKAARALNISLATLYNKLKKFNG